jgi:hypothetical protein
MMTTMYEAISSRVKMVSWPANSLSEFEGLLGMGNVNGFPGGIQIRNMEGEWITLGKDWVATLSEAGDRRILTPGAFAGAYRKID